MEVKKIDDSTVSVTASPGQWAQLYSIIEWVITEGGDMDDATMMMEPEEIVAVLNEWRQITTTAIRK